MNTVAATTLQSWLSANWERACKRLDDPTPLTPGFYRSMDNFYQAMNRFDAAEASLRRAGLTSCIGTPDKCAASVVSCRACGEVAPAAALDSDTASPPATHQRGL